MTKPILGVDVDLTICPSDKGWDDWLLDQSELFEIIGYGSQDKVRPYNLAECYPHVKDPLTYWRDLDYSQFKPLEGSVEALEALSEHFRIVFISQSKGQHGKSKYYWLEDHFPFKKGVMLTKEKWLMNDSVVAMIDDRMSHLQGFDLEKRILFQTRYTQDVEVDVAYEFGMWDNSVVSKICETYL
jgi:5'(3')-deoxyribonucleotidase